jgi:serine-threonine kinase receptor-associated protein
MEKKLRLFDLSRSSTSSSPTYDSSSPVSSATPESFEIGPGVHSGTIKSIVWSTDYNILITAAEDKKIRWWDLRTQTPIGEYTVDGVVGSCELDNTSADGVLSVAAGKSVYFFDSASPGSLIKSIKTPYELASVALHRGQNRFVTGGSSQNDTWVRVWDFNEEKELGESQALLYLRRAMNVLTLCRNK